MSTTLQRAPLLISLCAVAIIAVVYAIFPAPASAAFCPSLNRSLSVGSSGGDVSELQQFLAQDTLVYPSGLITGYFGSLTEEAVKKFQCKYNIVCSGDSATTGFGSVGAITRSKIAQACVGGGVLTSGMTLAVSPQSGATPLTVTATIVIPQPNVTPIEVCGPIVVGTISWGDGTPDTKPTRLGCSGQYIVTATHTYTTHGTHYVQLMDTNGVQRGVQTVVVTSGSAGATFTGTPATGAIPLEVEFFGRVISSSFGGVNIDYGDGTTAVLFCNPGVACTNTIKHIYEKVGTYTARLIAVGEGASSAINSMTIRAEEPGIPGVTVSLPEKVTSPGKSFSVSWSAANPPKDAKVRLEVWKSDATPTLGNNDQGLAGVQGKDGTISWNVPDESGCSADTGLVTCIKKGSYKIVAKLYTGGDCWGYCITGTARTVHAIGISPTFTVSDAALSTDFTVGNRVETNDALNVRETAAVNGKLLGTQAKGAQGTVQEGPKSADGFVWWKVDWDSGVDGWSVKDYIKKVSASTGALSASPTYGPAPLTVAFTGSTTVAYSGGVKLHFGNASTSTVFCAAGSACSNTISHTYMATGTYVALLVSVGAGGAETEIGKSTITVGGGTACTAPKIDLGLADTDAEKKGEVSVLQIFLKRDAAIYPEGLITGFYGHLTEQAVKRYQKKKDILQTGFVGPLTRTAIRVDCGEEKATETSKYSFSASPTSGAAPVLITFTALSAETKEVGVWYSVDFGDGTQGNMSADAANKAKLSASHTYNQGGTFMAKLLQNEDLCGQEGKVSFGCTKQLVIDSLSVAVSGGTTTSGGAGSCTTARFARGGTAGASTSAAGGKSDSGAQGVGGASGSSGGGYFPGALPQLAANEFMNYPGSDNQLGRQTAAQYLQQNFGAPTVLTYPNGTVFQANPAWWGGQANPGVPPDVGCNLYPRICYIYQCQNGAWMQRSTTQPFGEFMYPNVPAPIDTPNDGRL